MAELLIEIFSEEIPARMQARASADLSRLVVEGMKEAGLSFETVEDFATPRRLTLVVDGLPSAQPDIREERRGPKVDAPEKAVEGFLRANNVKLEDCEQRETKKGTFLFVVIEQKGRPTADVLAELLPVAFSKLPWPKSMRWGSGETKWVRPLQGLLTLFDGNVVDYEFGGLTACNTCRGHRFHAPTPFEVTGFADYREKLRSAYVILDPTERRKRILERARELAADEGFVLQEDNGLLDELAGLVEWPVPMMGEIEARFMAVPAEVLTTSMKINQKYLSLVDTAGNLVPRFITVANLEAEDGGAAIVAGNQFVLTARLADAEYFWNVDQKARLETRVPALRQVVFHAKLGSLGEKTRRVALLATNLSGFVPGAEALLCERSARLAKADLTSHMVGEFAELQGIMGRYYALHDGEDMAVANAIAAHYAPQGPSDACPNEPVSITVALADKLDTLAGFWLIDEKPTGSKDPYALRRAALGVIRLILENGLRLPLLTVLDRAFSGYPEKAAGDTASNLLAFFADRLKVHLRDTGVRHDLISAIFALGGEDDLVRLMARVQALSDFVHTDDGGNLLTAYRRAANILRIEEKKDKTSYDGDVAGELLAMAEESALNDALSSAAEDASRALKAEDFAEAMSALSQLRQPVDRFFDDVTVNAEEPELRENRLRLLAKIRHTLHQVADFSQIEGS